jgi:D-alanine-D-alanine ligase
MKEERRSLSLKDLNIAVFRGGLSPEREISLLSGENVFKALKIKGYKAIDIDLKTEDEAEILNIIKDNSIDLVFIALHGAFGEDGGIQKIFEENLIAFTGSRSYSSSLAMDKVASHRLLQENNISVPEYWVEDEGLPKFSDKDYPLVVKPYDSGSSIGVSIIKGKSFLSGALEKAYKSSKRVMVERYIEGRELTVGIVAQEVLPIVEMVCKTEFFDFTSKYHDKRTEFTVPAKLDNATARRIQNLSYKVYQVLGSRHFGRIDLRLDSNLKPFFLELNSIPGLTSHSLLPLAAKNKGISFGDLCQRIIKQAWDDFKKETIYEESTQKKN